LNMLTAEEMTSKAESRLHLFSAHASRLVVRVLDNAYHSCLQLLLQAQVLPIPVQLKHKLLPPGSCLMGICRGAVATLLCPKHLHNMLCNVACLYLACLPAPVAHMWCTMQSYSSSLKLVTIGYYLILHTQRLSCCMATFAHSTQLLKLPQQLLSWWALYKPPAMRVTL